MAPGGQGKHSIVLISRSCEPVGTYMQMSVVIGLLGIVEALKVVNSARVGEALNADYL